MTKILIVEDDAAIRTGIKEALQNEKYTVETASDGLEGLDAAFSFNPDLIISDINMPNMDGYGLINKLQVNDETKTIPFIFLSIKAENKDVFKGLQLGADDYLPKPFRIADLLAKVKLRLDKVQRIKETELLKEREKLRKYLCDIMKKPLISIKGYAEILVEDLSNTDHYELALEIRNSAIVLDEVLSRYLEYARKELNTARNNDDDLKSIQEQLEELLTKLCR